MTADNHKTGSFGEEYVAEFLKRHGYEIIGRNYRVKGGEIDVIARKDDVIAFVEVKTRKTGALTSGEEAITSDKRKHIITAAERFLSEYGEDINGRFDVAAVDMDIKNYRVVGMRYYKNAFDASNI